MAYPADNVKVNEYLNRRVDLEDVVEACLLAAERAPAIGFWPVHRRRDDPIHAG